MQNSIKLNKKKTELFCEKYFRPNLNFFFLLFAVFSGWQQYYTLFLYLGHQAMGMWLMSTSYGVHEHTHSLSRTDAYKHRGTQHIIVYWAQCNHNDKADCLNTQMGLPTACVYVFASLRVCVSVDNTDWIADL